MDRDALTKRLMTLFLGELEEHERTLERDLLALENEPDVGAHRELVESLFRAAHSLKGAARAVQAGPIESICHQLERTLSELRDQPEQLTPPLLQGMFARLDSLREAAARLRADAAPSRARELPPIPTPVIQPIAVAPKGTPSWRSDEPPAELRAARIATPKLDALLAHSGDLVVVSARVQAGIEALLQLHEPRARRAPGARAELGESDAEQAESAQLFERFGGSLRRDLSALLGVTRRVDDGVRGLRMTPFRDACEGLERSVRDLARSLGKQVQLVIEGEQVEIDRDLVQRLRDPLQHLIRNAVSHGIETAPERASCGKPALGRVSVQATVRGRQVELSVEDDGRGLDYARIRERARTLGLPEPADDEELASYIFAPGLTTASSVDEISGRGVGLDAVKRSIEALHGEVRVAMGQLGGARFTMRLPLTLSKMRCVLARCAGMPYAIPTNHAVRALRVRAEQLLQIGGNELIRADSELVPVVPLATLLGLPERPLERNHAEALVVSSDGRSVALLASEIFGERECIVQALPARVAAARHVAGATVLSNGQVALVLNGSELGRAALQRLARPTASVFRQDASPRRRVLVADDSITTRALIKSIVESAGYEVSAARDGAEAFRLLQEQSFDLLVSDVQMPRLDGFALTAQIRSTPALARLPVILVTSLEGESDRLRGLEAGASAYLGKGGFDRDVLLDLIRSLL